MEEADGQQRQVPAVAGLLLALAGVGVSAAIGSLIARLIPKIWLISFRPGIALFVVNIILGALIAVVIPFLLGKLAYRWGFLISLTYAIVYVFIVLHWHYWDNLADNFGWFSSGRPFVPIAISVVVIATGIGYLSSNTGSRSPFPLNVKHAFAVLLPLVFIAVAASVVLWSPLNKARVGPPLVKSYPEYGFTIHLPAGWSAGKPTTSPGRQAGPLIERYKDLQISFYSPEGFFKEGNPRVNLFRYQQMPISGAPLVDFKTAEEVYEALDREFREVQTNPPQYTKTRDWSILYQPYENSIVDGINAMVVFFKEGYGDVNKELSQQYREVFIYKQPYLYRLSINIPFLETEKGQKLFHQLLQDIEFE